MKRKTGKAAGKPRSESRTLPQLESVVSTIRRKTAAKQSSLAIFDLDGTLFDNRTRTLFILREISEKFAAKTPGLGAAFTRPPDLSVIDYGLESTLGKMGVRHPAEIAFIKQEWAERFFSDDYQRYDMPIPGAKAFVDQVHEAGATVIYLTGRDVGRMLVGCTEVLRLYGFPVGVAGTMTIVKKEFEQDDEIFKKEVSDYIDRLGEVVAVFENEPANSNALHARFPSAASFLVMTQHRPDAPSLDAGIRRISDFRLPA